MMKKILVALFLGLLMAGCSTTATQDNTTPATQTDTNTDTAASQADTTQPDQDQIARQQIAAFEANQVKMYTHPVDN